MRPRKSSRNCNFQYSAELTRSRKMSRFRMPILAEDTFKTDHSFAKSSNEDAVSEKPYCFKPALVDSWSTERADFTLTF